MVNLTINGMELEVEEDLTILQVAEKNGIKIPTLCYNKALPSYGACRLCLVEISQKNGRTSIQTSCTYPVQEGLIVKTDTERVIKSRKIMVELMLAKCPESEVLQNLAKEMEVCKPRIELKNDDCVLCGLCVRMCESRMGRGAIGFANRGIKRVVVAAFDNQSEDCQTCGACDYICPTQKGIKFNKITENKVIPILSKFDEGLVRRSAIYIPFPQAVPNFAKIDPEFCVQLNTGECKICTEYCDAEAINFDHKEETLNLDVGSVIIANGADKFDPTPMHEYGFGRFPNVLTSIQFERILAASGPYEGHLQRPVDGKVPVKIAWIQCVGSRTEHSHMPYCSSVCCMYAMKEAIIAKEHVPTVEPTIFFMDLRAHGKDFDKYYDKAKAAGIKFKRSRIGKIKEIPETGNLELYQVKENGDFVIEEFEMVVLSVGLLPPKDIIKLSDSLGVRLNEHNFIEHLGISQIETTRPGVFVCGPAVSPKDIPETVTQASGAATEAAELLSEVRGTEITDKVYPEERTVAGLKPRIGVFVCHCGINIGSVVNVPSSVEFALTLPNVVYAGENIFTCSQDTQQLMKEIIVEHKLNRVVVASCSPSTHEPLFQETLREAGLNPYLFEMANIRNHCSWVHRDDHAKATEKAKTLIKIAVGKSRLQEPLHSISLDVTQKGLVIGGGLAGITAALSIANQGFEVALVEREDKLGGNLNSLSYTLDGIKVADFLQDLKDQIDDNPLVKVYLNSKIKGIDGYIGNFKTKIEHKEEIEEFEHGIIIIATGAKAFEPTEYFYGKCKKIITQHELEQELEEKEKEYAKLKNVAFIQCVGSRDEEHPYCSRICCSQAMKNAMRLKKLNPKMNVTVLYRDIRTYGFYEKYYQQAREMGILFIRYNEEEKPVVTLDSKMQVLGETGLLIKTKDYVLGTEITLNPEKIIISPAIIPQDDVEVLSQMLKIPLNEDKFFMEAHVKLRPVDFSAEGIFLAGLAHSPKGMEDSISQAKAAAGRACSIISSKEYISEANIAEVDLDMCAGCGMCVSVCPYGAPELFWMNEKEYAHVNSGLCKGCGSCAAICPSGAMQQLGYKEEQTLAMLNEALEVW
ncbi:MAG: FAD-dependent oxidoreductase [Candidatus Cloacimonetes bacterium]|nr:FAD-dependent oxidoreductase [Candidatus Cloacimonadota bacterium]